MKRLGILGLATICLAAFGCSPATDIGGESAGEEGAKSDLVVGIVFDSGGKGDKSFNDSAWRGMQQAEGEFGITTMDVESASENDYANNLSMLAERGADLVFAIGGGMQRALETVAPQHPDTKFAIVDAEVGSPNVLSLRFKEEEGSFLAGFIAAKTGADAVGFIGGKKIPLIEKFESGYFAGAMYANPNIQILPAKYTDSWDNVDKAKEAANVLYGDGADIIYHAAGRAGLGLFSAAKDQGKYAIGVDSDQDDLEPGTIVTSMIKSVDQAVYDAITDLVNGQFESTVRIYDLGSGLIGISDLRHSREMFDEDLETEIADLKSKIASGEIAVPTTRAEYDAFVAGLK